MLDYAGLTPLEWTGLDVLAVDVEFAVGKVEPRDIQAGAEHPLEHWHGTGGGANRGDDSGFIAGKEHHEARFAKPILHNNRKQACLACSAPAWLTGFEAGRCVSSAL